VGLDSRDLRYAAPLRAIICGDFNTPPEDDNVQELVARGWIRAEAGFRFLANNGSEHEIDHAFLSPGLALQMARASWASRPERASPMPGLAPAPAPAPRITPRS
jgi:endonuclease/exonuclease/phosphatase family metal-dependent hydrolase